MIGSQLNIRLRSATTQAAVIVVCLQFAPLLRGVRAAVACLACPAAVLHRQHRAAIRRFPARAVGTGICQSLIVVSIVRLAALLAGPIRMLRTPATPKRTFIVQITLPIVTRFRATFLYLLLILVAAILIHSITVAVVVFALVLANSVGVGLSVLACCLALLFSVAHIVRTTANRRACLAIAAHATRTQLVFRELREGLFNAALRTAFEGWYTFHVNLPKRLAAPRMLQASRGFVMPNYTMFRTEVLAVNF